MMNFILTLLPLAEIWPQTWNSVQSHWLFCLLLKLRQMNENHDISTAVTSAPVIPVQETLRCNVKALYMATDILDHLCNA
jgi:hypothetical protein